jgi:hypothetical protein
MTKKHWRILAIIWTIVIFYLLVSFREGEPKVYTFQFTGEEAQVIFDALGELPSKKVEGIRAKMMQTVLIQNDTTKIKR